MREPKPTTHELNVASSNGGKLPDSYKKRVKEYEEWLAKQEEEEEEKEKTEEKDSEKSNDSETNEAFAQLPDDTEFPHHYGGGNYYLSDGTKVGSKEKAVEAQKELDAEESTEGGGEDETADEPNYPEGIDAEKAKEAFAELEDPDFPEHWYSGHYFLSDGSVVAGKQDAIEAQKALDED